MSKTLHDLHFKFPWYWIACYTQKASPFTSPASELKANDRVGNESQLNLKIGSHPRSLSRGRFSEQTGNSQLLGQQRCHGVTGGKGTTGTSLCQAHTENCRPLNRLGSRKSGSPQGRTPIACPEPNGQLRKYNIQTTLYGFYRLYLGI